MCDEVPICISDDEEEVKKKKKPDSFSDEQNHALNAAKEGRSVFITGSAGVGKSYILKEILKLFDQKTAFVTASTGVAACNIGGTTLHSFAGIGLGEKDATVLASSIKNNKFKAEVKTRWMRCRVLVIDEISMIDGCLFEKVEKVARLVRSIEKPFGGIQLILCGDFLQLPPVKSKYFAFETKAWKKVVEETVVLKKVFRQKEVGLITLLNRLRTGQFIQLDVEVLGILRDTKFVDDGIKATRLFPHRYSCDDLNNKELGKLKGPSIVYTSTDNASKPMYMEMLQKNSKFKQRLELKSGAQVMLLVNKNVQGSLVNGARGVVVGFRNRSRSLYEDLQKILAEKKEGDDHINGLNDKSLLEKSMMVEADIVNDDDDDGEHSDDEKPTPIVLFANGVVDVVNKDRMSINVGVKTVASRVQIPLLLAWAVSIHKSQGMTLDRIDVDISKSFEHGQSYVALSRVTSLDGLLLRDFKAEKITAHPKVLTYYKGIDPTFDKFPVEGEVQLKIFLDRRKNCDKYADVLKNIQQRNESEEGCSEDMDHSSTMSPTVVTNKHSTSRIANLKKTSPKDFTPFLSKAQEETNKLSPSKETRYTSPKSSLTDTTSTAKNINATTSEISKSEREQIRAKAKVCNLLGNEESTPIKYVPLGGRLGRRLLSSHKTSLPTVVDCEEEGGGGSSTSSAIVVQDTSDFDDSIVTGSTCHSPANNFLDNICPDLLHSAGSVANGNIAKRKRSGGGTDTCDKSPKRMTANTGNDRMKTLLKTKASEIENKRKAALERRRISLLRSSQR